MGHFRSDLRDVEFDLFEVLRVQDGPATPDVDRDPDTLRDLLRELDRLATGPLGEGYAEADRHPPVFDPATHTVTVPEPVRRAYRLLWDGEWWRLVTGGFLHFGPIHLLFNMMALWVIGRDIEPALGHARFLAVYLVSLLGGSAAVLLLSPPTANVAGASGAVFGLMGALAVLLRRLRVPLGQVGMLIAINLVITFLIPGISVAGHLGGLVVGAAATAALVYAPGRRASVQAVLLSGIALVLLAVVALSMASMG